MSTAPAPTRQQISPPVVEAFNRRTIILRLKHGSRTARLLLVEVAKAHTPPLTFERIVEDLDLDVLKQCCQEDLEIKNMDVRLVLWYPEVQNLTPLNLPRHLRAGIQSIINAGSDNPGYIFELVPIDQTLDQRSSLQSTPASQGSGKSTCWRH